jgi:peptidyl-prolyl cis-trans isomerase A (cyclophilin A)
MIQKAKIMTDQGSIIVKFFSDQAPAGVVNFLQDIDRGYYRATQFYRVARADNDIMPHAPAQPIQGGVDFYGMAQLPCPSVIHEASDMTGLERVAGTISGARNEPGTAASEIFINVTDNHCISVGGNRVMGGRGVAVFGRVISGMVVVRTMQALR